MAKIACFLSLLIALKLHNTCNHINKYKEIQSKIITKAFDKVSFEVLFDVLLGKYVCRRIVNLLYYMYANQLCHEK